jgi:hypothetical protein
MLHCFNCGSDLPDNIVFCLHCGARLDDETATVVHTAPRTQEDPQQPVLTPPKPRAGIGKLIIGGLIGAGAVIGIFVVLGVVLYSIQSNDNQNGITTNVKTPTPTATQTATPKLKTPTPTPADVSTDSEEECDIVNPQGGDVNLRRDCDTKDCSLDPSTLYIQVAPGEIVVPTGKPRVTTGKFTWVQVKYKGETLWVSSTRLDCL